MFSSTADGVNTVKVTFLAFWLIVVQAVDGLLTSLGVSTFGIEAEGNPLIRAMMYAMGHNMAIGLAKFVAVLLVITLAVMARKRGWIGGVLGALTCFYLAIAIIPWTVILITNS
jgi:hypothetical protein